MISTELARALHDSGLVWHPAVGDAFRIDRIEVDADVFYLSDMTVEAHDLPTGTQLGFNGTTEWALDSVAIEDALWLPSESQLRERIGDSFVALDYDGTAFRVRTRLAGEPREFAASIAEDAYARALLAHLDQARD
ncbi:MAG TPA: pilus assembly protein CpaE [Galbitalea sp.]|jgi:phage gp29-like protein|nr:pilus assembly protein CpaE [Galbitalea sp.]